MPKDLLTSINMLLLVPFLMILAGLALRFGVGLAFGVRGPEPGNIVHLASKVVSWLLVGGGLVVWSLLPLAGTVGALAICVPMWVLMGFAVIDGVRSAREAHRRTVSKLLAVAIREGSLPDAYSLLSQTDAGWFVGEAATGLAYELHDGQQLYESVAHHKAALPRDATAYAAIGTLVSAEPDALDELSRHDDPQLAIAWRWWYDHVTYSVALLLTMGILVGLFSLFVIPEFRNIYWDFGLQLPATTDVVLRVSEENIVWILLISAIVLALIGGFVVAVFYLLDVPVLRGLTDWLFRRTHTAEALRLLALAIEHRGELPRTLYALSVTHPVRAVRSRLSASYQDVAAGQPWADVLMHNRLLSPSEKGLVETAEAVGNLPWALRQIARRRESQLAATMAVAGNVMQPLMILAIAGFVGFVCIALFLPIVKLVEGLS